MKKLLLLLSIVSLSILAQNTGSITGRVIDISTLQPLAGVTIVVEGTNLGNITNSEGYYEIANVPVGTYTLKASYISYRTLIKTDVIVKSSGLINIDFNLEQSSLELEGVTITSDYFQKDPRENVSLSSFSYEEIRRSPGGFEDVIRALSVLPGVAQADAGRNDLIVRGGAPSENLYLIDEIVVPNINHFGSQGATGGPLSFIDLNFVKETSFSAGGFSAIYGDKLSSVLRVNIRDGRKDKFGGKAIISATQFGLNAEGPIGDDATFLFSARRSYLDLIFQAAGFNFIPEYYDVLTKVKYNLDNYNNFSFLFISAFDNVKFNNNDSEQRYKNSRILGSDQIQYTAGLTYTHLFDKGFYDITLSRNFVDFDSFQRDSLLNPVFQNLSREQENTLKSDMVYKFSSQAELNFGIIGKLIKFDADILVPTFRTTFNDSLLITQINQKNIYYKGGAYLQYINQFTERIKVNAGVRVDYFNAIKENYFFSPRASLTYSLTEKTNINLSAGIYSQAPSYIWLLAFNNADRLKYIKVNQYIAGIEQTLHDDILLRTEVFYKDYYDYPASTARPYLVMSNTGAGFEGSDDNYASFGLDPLESWASGYSRGVELLIQKKASTIPLYGILSVTFSEAFYTALDNIKRRGSYDQKWIFSLSGGYEFGESWIISTKFRFSTGKPYTPFEEFGRQSVSKYNTLILPSNHSLDLRIDKTWNFKGWNMTTYLDIQNIYNRNNITNYRWDYRENKIDDSSSFGILPSIGVIIEI